MRSVVFASTQRVLPPISIRYIVRPWSNSTSTTRARPIMSPGIRATSLTAWNDFTSQSNSIGCVILGGVVAITVDPPVIATFPLTIRLLYVDIPLVQPMCDDLHATVPMTKGKAVATGND